MSQSVINLSADLQRVVTASERPAGFVDEMLSGFVQSGLGHFGLNHLEDHDGLFTELKSNNILSSVMAESEIEWFDMSSQLTMAQLELAAPLRKLAADFELDLAGLFMLALCGEIESSYPVNMAMAQLQAPDNTPRPMLHCLCGVINYLFNKHLTPASIAAHPLITTATLQLHGNDPLPLRTLSISSRFWQLLNGRDEQWAEVRVLGGSAAQVDDEVLIPHSLKQQLPELHGLLQMQAVQGVVIRGSQRLGEILAQALAKGLGRKAVSISAEHWRTMPLLHLAARYAGWLPVINLKLGPAERYTVTLNATVPMVFTSGRDGAVEIDNLLEIETPAPLLAQRQLMWQRFSGGILASAELAKSALIDGVAIRNLVKSAELDARRQGVPLNKAHIICARHRHVGKQLRLLAQPVVRQVERDELILPTAAQQQFDHLVERCLQRESMWSGLGATARVSSNHGVRVLFSGESGTGKTLAASHLATRLSAPLFRLDIASVVNKYIGETEKNLGLLLDEAAASDTILLLDEADALFGKRTEGEGAGDRFANMLTNFLLTRIENHSGIVILTSNNRALIDAAFTRRLDAIIEFQLPSVAERMLIWQSHLGKRSPGDDFCHQLSSFCELPGGFIRNAVLSAAVMSPGGADELISQETLLNALSDEYRKLGRALPPVLAQMRPQHE